ncbi:MAG: UTP--glucose-1-phosphate uridylyltransferase [Fibrobacter sp.]|nr:UTP--glucose-1-phosphate uridylyltransferase [Fibrobacter sp.]
MTIIDQFINKMHNEHIGDKAITVFTHYYSRLVAGETGLLPENQILPVPGDTIDSFDKIHSTQSHAQVRSLLSKTVCIKLNGGLGTTMGLKGPKSLLPVKNDLTFLDITCRQIRAFNNSHDLKIPLLLMNSFRTESESHKILARYPELRTSIPSSFLQHKFPKVRASDFTPVTYPQDTEMEWNPPGHGDIYIALETSGILEKLLQADYRYAFISNIDNLGATLDTEILAYIESHSLPFLLEVTERTEMDRKGGHLARHKNGHLVLREAAQCPDESLNEFSNIDKYCFFNTNNLWIDLRALKDTLDKSEGFLDLPMIRNRKKVNPLDRHSDDVFQVESAMGAAISLFPKAAALSVPRTRFAPVKNCNDLLLLWSDAFIIDTSSNIIPNPDRKHSVINVDLDPEYYSFINDLISRFPFGAPSMIGCTTLTVRGDITFGKSVSLLDNVTLRNISGKPENIADNSILSGNHEFSSKGLTTCHYN